MPLKPVVGPVQLVFYSIGVIVGAGVYSVVGVAAGMAGDGLWLSFLLGAVVAALTGLAYAEMTTAFPAAGAEYVYLRIAFPKAHWASFGVGIVILLGGAASAAAVAVAFGGYFAQFWSVPIWLSAGGLLAGCTLLNVLGLRESSWANILFTSVEVAGLLLVIAVGLTQDGFARPLTSGAVLQPGMLAASALLFFVYLGFEEIANLSEEVRNPARDIPQAIFWSLGITTALYILVALAALALARPDELASSAAPLATAVSKAWPSGVPVLSAIALFATANTVLITMIATSRLAYAMARDGDMPHALAGLLPERGTPWVAALVTFGVSALLVPVGGVGVLAGLSSFAALLAFFAVNTTLVVLRRTQADIPRPFRIPGAVGFWPVVPLVSIALIALLITQFDRQVYVGGAIGLLASGLFFAMLKHSQKRKLNQIHK